jgi:hypothetical protein
MSQNNIPARLPAIEKLITRINSAEKSNQKEIKLTMQESKDLVYELAILTSRLGTTVQEIHQMLSELRESTTKIDVKFDGGTF